MTTSPSADTKEPVPPLLKRTVASCTFLSHASVTSKPYFFLISALGTLLKVHMPSSARTRLKPDAANKAMRRALESLFNFMVKFPRGYISQQVVYVRQSQQKNEGEPLHI